MIINLPYMIPKISIIIPCYKVEKYLDRCVKSVVNQTFRDIEIILVDDCSPDEVPQMCDGWAKKDNRIKVIHKTVNQDLGFARNTGLEVAKGDYVAFVDADDYVEEDMYDKLYNEAIAYDSDIVFCGMKQERTQGNFVPVRDVTEKKIFTKAELQELSIRYFDPKVGRKLIMSVWHSVYRRSLISDIRFYSEREVCSEDLPFQVMAINRAETVLYIPDTLYYYCLNANSLSHTFNFDKIFRYFNLANIILEYYPTELQHHVWKFFLSSCQDIIRKLVRSNLKYRDKIYSIKKLTGNSEIHNILKSQKRNLSLNKMQRLYCNCMIGQYNQLLYIVAFLDVHVVCDKLGIKKCN